MSAQIHAWLYGIAGGIIVALLVGLWFQNLRLTHCQRTAVALQTGLDKAVAANKDQAGAIVGLQAANKGFADKALAQHREYLLALADLARANVRREALQRALLAKEATDKASGACRAVLDIDLSVPCPNIAAAIKERAQ